MRIRDPKNVHMDPDPWGLRLKKKNYTNKFSINLLKLYKKSLKINKLNFILSITKESLLLNLQFRIHLINLYIFYAFLPPGSGSASLYADPGGLFKCGSMRIRIRQSDFNTIFK